MVAKLTFLLVGTWRIVAGLLGTVAIAAPCENNSSGEIFLPLEPRRKLSSSIRFMGHKPSSRAMSRQKEDARRAGNLLVPKQMLLLHAAPYQVMAQQAHGKKCVAASAQARRGAMCGGRDQTYIRLVHVPKAGGMSLSCTFQPPHHETLCRKGMGAGVMTNSSFQGQKHETYYQIKEQCQCSGDVYKRCVELVSRSKRSVVANPLARKHAAVLRNTSSIVATTFLSVAESTANRQARHASPLWLSWHIL